MTANHSQPQPVATTLAAPNPRRLSKFKLKGIARKIYISDLADWVPKADLEYDHYLKKEVLKLSDSDFENKTRRLLLHFVNEAFRNEIQFAMKSRARHYFKQLENDMNTLGHGAFTVSSVAITKMAIGSLKSMEQAILSVAHNPSQTQFKNFDYQKTFERIVEYRKSDIGFSKDSLRKDIRFNLYDACDDIRALYDMRFSKEAEAIQGYWDCIKNNILHDPGLAYFLRGSKETNIDYKEFELVKKRFKDEYIAK